ncbi:MAG: tRNA pseudouridine(55) synthase [Archangium sp.]|nr:tRNA pseudouridine(55) synthase [Archangium sp.]MDP3151102.1 tRNA pseudouridine(55) synthase [Archangium sp.]MDP3571786.1 tRNA pseudouridine(55) synthase [Archangium sp.]
MKRPPSALWRVHKPPGVSSASLVDDFRQTHGGNFTLKVSHGGVLDPFAEGLVLLLVGAANRLFEALHEVPKTYVAQVRWGLETDTGDAGGREVRRGDANGLTPDQLDAALISFRGWTAQTPPATSNKRVDGERAYVKAHRGEEVVLPPQQVYLHSAKWRSHELPISSTLEVVVRGGFYVRSLATGLGRALGVGAHLSALNRTAIGSYEDVHLPVQHIGRDVLPWLPSMELNDAQWGELKREVNPQVLRTPGTWALPEGFPTPTAGVRALHQGRLVALIRNGPPLLLPGGI